MSKTNTQKFINFINKDSNLTSEQRMYRNKLLAKGEKSSNENNKSEYVRPEYLHDFLYAYNQDNMLKYTCHEIDSREAIDAICKECKTDTYSFVEHQKLLSERFSELVKQVEKDGILDKRFYSLAKALICGGSKWSEKRIEEGWKCEGIMAWGEANPSKIPNPGKNIARMQKSNGYRLKNCFKSNIKDDNCVSNFSQLTLYFKSLFHIRRDNPLRDILEFCFSSKLKVEYPCIKLVYSDEFADNIELFTNVEKVIAAFEKVVQICAKAHELDKDEEVILNLSFYRGEDNKTIFSIHDVNSVYGKDLTAARLRIGERQKELINIINGICDLAIEADFGNEAAHLNLWHSEVFTSNSSKFNITSTPLDSFAGVKYLLIFPS